MNELRKAKIQVFLNDQMMSQAVFDVLRDSFLKSSGQRDVQVLAAERLAVDLLQNAWLDLERFKEEEDGDAKKLVQVGL